MFWLSYECFSIFRNAFLLKSAISSHNSCVECTAVSSFTSCVTKYLSDDWQLRCLSSDYFIRVSLHIRSQNSKFLIIFKYLYDTDSHNQEISYGVSQVIDHF